MAINVALLNPRSSRRLPTVVNVVYLTDLIDIRIDCVLRLTSFAIRQLCNLLQQPAQKTNSRKFRFVSLRFRFDLIRFFRLTRIKCIYQFIYIYIQVYVCTKCICQMSMWMTMELTMPSCGFCCLSPLEHLSCTGKFDAGCGCGCLEPVGAFSTPVWHIAIDLHWISITAACRLASQTQSDEDEKQALRLIPNELSLFLAFSHWIYSVLNRRQAHCQEPLIIAQTILNFMICCLDLWQSLPASLPKLHPAGKCTSNWWFFNKTKKNFQFRLETINFWQSDDIDKAIGNPKQKSAKRQPTNFHL